MIVGERVDGPNEMGCSPLLSPLSQTRYPAFFSQIFDVEHQTQELWGSSWSSRSLTLIFDMDLESWHAQKTSKKQSWECSFAPTKTIPNQLQQSIHHPPTTNIITQPLTWFSLRSSCYKLPVATCWSHHMHKSKCLEATPILAPEAPYDGRLPGVGGWRCKVWRIDVLLSTSIWLPLDSFLGGWS